MLVLLNINVYNTQVLECVFEGLKFMITGECQFINKIKAPPDRGWHCFEIYSNCILMSK